MNGLNFFFYSAGIFLLVIVGLILHSYIAGELRRD